MAFTLTKYIYPISEKILLSNSCNYCLDNPRTEKEILFVKNYIAPALERHYESSKEQNYNPMLSAALGIGLWKEYIKEKDNYAFQFFQSNYKISIEDVISKSWLIIRYDDNGEFDRAEENKNAFFDIFFTDAKHAYLETYNTMLSYFQLLSLLCHDEDTNYFGSSMILLKRPQDVFYPIDHTHEIIEAFDNFTGNVNIAVDNRAKTWEFYPDVKDNLIQVVNTLEILFASDIIDKKKEKRIKQTPKEKLFFVGDLLRIIEMETEDVKVKLLLLVSIIEFMVTRNPDSQKFNVEDSIIKQFVLKTCILLYADNTDINLDELKSNLKQIYGQRSDVAHGNFISKKDNEKIIESFYKLFTYIRSITFQYIKNVKFVDFLKEN